MNSELYDFSDSLETEEVDSFVMNIEQPGEQYVDLGSKCLLG